MRKELRVCPRSLRRQPPSRTTYRIDDGSHLLVKIFHQLG